MIRDDDDARLIIGTPGESYRLSASAHDHRSMDGDHKRAVSRRLIRQALKG
jgi:hypothetical protein